MKFSKWPSIENLQTELERKSSSIAAAEAMACRWAATEKIDGANIGINVEADSFRINSRTHMLAEDEKFFGIHRYMDGMLLPLVEKVQAALKESPETVQITLQGEYFGSQILNRIDYGRDADVRFFGACSVEKDGEGGFRTIQWTLERLDGFLKKLGRGEMMVPVLAVCGSFGEACAVSNALPSALGAGAVMEGTVVEPWDAPWSGADASGRPVQLIFKSKNERFLEKPARKRRPPVQLDGEAARLKALNLDFIDLCTESRMWSTISKIGMPADCRNFGPYVKPFLDDAWEDFLKTHEGQEFSPKERKAIACIGAKGFKLFGTVAARMLREAEAEQAEAPAPR